MTNAAGILFLDPNGRVLMIQRAPGEGDHEGEWSFPGGKVEAGETPAEAAARECREELRVDPARLDADAGLVLHMRRVQDGVDYTTFLKRVSAPFKPRLNSEHTDFVWADPSALPQPVHPGAQVAVDKLKMNELDLARAMAAGQVASPQRYENMALFAMRITGTGASYRSGLDEYVWRDPSLYLNDEFLARCNGLPVIVEHPEKNSLDSKEFQERVIGTIMLPYLKNDEVWGIAKVFDDAAIEMLEKHQLSTSPAVVFRDPAVNKTEKLGDGSTLLIEGKPSLLDHLAICEVGVWDKGGEPAGVDSTLTNGGSAVSGTNAEEDRAKADAEAGEKLDKILACVDSMTKRVDSLEGRFGKKDGETDPVKPGEPEDPEVDEDNEDMPTEMQARPEDTAADKARKDAARATWRKDRKARKDTDEKAKLEEENKVKELADKARRDAEDETRKRIADLEAKMPKELSDADYAEMANEQADADKVHAAFGDAAPRPLRGESLMGYRRRLASGFQKHSPAWKDIDLGALPGKALEVAKSQIYADAMRAAKSPEGLPEGQLRSVVSRDLTGRQITTFVGEPRAWMGQFTASRRRLVGIRKEGR